MTKDIKRFTFRLPDALFDAIGRKAKELGVSRNALILQILWDWANRSEGTCIHHLNGTYIKNGRS